jgi:hypothetical protein
VDTAGEGAVRSGRVGGIVWALGCCEGSNGQEDNEEHIESHSQVFRNPDTRLFKKLRETDIQFQFNLRGDLTALQATWTHDDTAYLNRLHAEETRDNDSRE